MALRHKLNDVLETETQCISVSTAIGVWKRFCFRFQKKGTRCSEYENGNVFPGNTFPGNAFPFPEKKHVSVWTEAGNRNALHFRFQENKKDYNFLTVCLWSTVQTMIPSKQSG